MRVETVQVELRPRTAWEAMELGNALVRRHAPAIWGPSLLLGLPLFVVLNALGWAIDQLWLAALALWWLKPVFDRVPLFVLSRAVFGAAPGMRATLAAQLRWGWRPLIGHLTWRRFSPWRAVTLPVDLLEGLTGAPLAQRRRLLLSDGIGGHALLLTVICQLFVAALLLSLILLVLMFVPTELLSESARAMWALISEQPPRWVQVLGNLAFWMAIGLVEPFYIGAGFGLYLNRRTQLEAWDLEIAFRRLRARLVPAATLMIGLLLAGLMLAPMSGHAQDPATGGDSTREINPTKTWRPGERRPDAAEDDEAQVPTLPVVFGNVEDGASFGRAIERAYADPLLDNTREVTRWQRKDADDRKDAKNPLNPNAGLLAAIAQVFALIAEYGLWIVLAILVGVLAWTARHWWPWMRDTLGLVRAPSEIVVEAAPPPPEALPADLVSEVRRLWAEGRHRRALALLYRGSVEAMTTRAGVTLVPGATEAQVLRASRRLPDAEGRDAFAEMVCVWQRAAYGQRLPDDEGLEALLARLAPRFGWSA